MSNGGFPVGVTLNQPKKSTRKKTEPNQRVFALA